MIAFNCASCGQHLETAQDLSGSQVQCPVCKKLVVVPSVRGKVQPPSLPVSSVKKISIVPFILFALGLMSIAMTVSTVYLSFTLSQRTEQIAELSRQIEELKNQDSYAYVRAGKLLDDGNLKQAIQAYQSFIHNFPDSPKVPNATKYIEEISTRMGSIEKEKTARSEHELQEKAQRDLAQKIRYKALPYEEWRGILQGKTKREVKSLLGSPLITFQDDNEWHYPDKILYPDSGNRGNLNVFFKDGVVSRYTRD